ncbi:MAG: hypothetical protein LBE06_01670 [Azoarcus sp.]|jgi:hypothetical protein|nr:hypothetical protein [Azoarcus sp.]
MSENRIEGGAEQGEQARSREALVIKARRRKFGGCAMKECVLTANQLDVAYIDPHFSHHLIAT